MDDGLDFLFYFPSTWMVVDDQDRFLNSFEMSVPDDQPLSIWNNPAECLDKANFRDGVGSWQIAERYSVADGEQLIIRYELDEVLGLCKDSTRFSNISVIVSDYAMPGMDGLELFKRVHDPNVGKILLTGAADESLAVSAFNEGLIDRFVMKSEPDALLNVVQYAKSLQSRYFAKTQQAIFRSLPDYILNVLRSREFKDFFKKGREKLKIVEYYFSNEPFGFYCLDAMGSPYFFAVATSDYLLDHKQVVSTSLEALPTDYLGERDFVTCLFEGFDSTDASSYDWKSNTVFVNKILDANGLYAGWHHSPPMDIDYDPKVAGFNSYLSKMRLPSL